MKLASAAALTLGLAMTAAAADPAGRVYELRTYTAAPGKLDAMLARVKTAGIPALKRHGITPVAFFVPADNKDNQVITVSAHDSLAARKGNWEAFAADAEWKAAVADTEKDGKLVAKMDAVVLITTDYSPDLAAFKSGDAARIFELRTYTATTNNLGALNARFRDHTTKLFAKYGMTNVVYWTTAPGEPKADVTLIYLLAHPSADAMKVAFDKFRLDPDWVAAKDASEKAAGGPLTEAKDGVLSKVLVPVEFSPIK